VAGVVSTLAAIGVAQQSSAARFAELHKAITKQHSMLMTMVEGNTARDAQLAQHGKRMARVEILFDKFDQQLPSLAQGVEACSEFGPTAAAVASTLNKIRDHTATTTQTVSQRLHDAGVWPAWRSGLAIPADEDGAAPYPVGHSQRSAYTRSSSLRDMPTEVRRGHQWSFNDREVDDDKVS
jgi:hypothetical protein